MTEDVGLFKFSEPHRIVYVSLVEPRKSQLRSDPRYEVTFLVPEGHADLTNAANVAAAVARAAFPGRDLGSLHFPFKKGDAEAAKAEAKGKKRENLKGFRLIQASSPEPFFTLAGLVNGRFVDFDSDAEKKANASMFYAGVEAYGILRFKAYEGMGGGVSAYIQNVTSLNRGERIGGGIRGSEAFSGYIGITTDEDPTKSGGIAGIL